MHDMKESNIFTYPNPSTGIVNITNLKLNSALLVHNMSGKLVLMVPVNAKMMQINMKNQSNGIYLITVESEGQIEHLRLVKQ